MPLLGHDDAILFNDVANDAESAQIKNYVIIASLKSESVGKLINRMPASQCQQAVSKPCLVHLISKDTHLVSYICLISDEQTFSVYEQEMQQSGKLLNFKEL